MKYRNEPVVIEQFFDDETYSHIKLWLSEIVPTIPLDSDRRMPDSTYHKFNRRQAQNLPFTIEIHQQLVEFACDVFGEKVKPSYSFLSMYDDKGKCPLHLDRPPCRYTIDYLVEQETPDPWPLRIGPHMTDDEALNLEVRDVKTTRQAQQVIDQVSWYEINLSPNDAVCYSGTNAWHYRPKLSNGTATLIFFHFVPDSFNGSLL